MNIFKTSSLSFLSTLIKTLVLFVLNKLVAIFGGSAGLMVLGNLQNYTAIMHLIAGTMYQTGSVKFAAELNNDKEETKFLVHVLSLGLIQAICISMLLFFFNEYISIRIFGDKSYTNLVNILLLSLPFVVFSFLFLAFLNGTRKISRFIGMSILTSLVCLFVVMVSGFFFGIRGIYCGFAGYYIVVGSLVILFNLDILKSFYFRVSIHRSKTLLLFSLITISSILINNVTLISIRGSLSNLALDNYAGYWQGVWNLSQVALSFITLSLSTYLLPSLSSATSCTEINRDVKKTLFIVVPFSIFIGLFCFLFKEQIVLLVFTKEFLPMTDLFLWQFIGNVIKTVSWVFGFVLISKGLVGYTIASELILSVFFVYACNYLIGIGYPDPATLAYFLSACGHLLMMVVIYYKVINCDKIQNIDINSNL
jgi:PST family polysaccharide transporter